MVVVLLADESLAGGTLVELPACPLTPVWPVVLLLVVDGGTVLDEEPVVPVWLPVVLVDDELVEGGSVLEDDPVVPVWLLVEEDVLVPG